jgi:predicted transcriptional regulator
MHTRREEARELRRQGMSVKEIARTMGASVGSVSVWVRDIVLTEAQVETLKNRQRRIGAQQTGAQANRAKFKRLRSRYQEEGRAKAREQRPLHMIGCMLYWAEGAKHKNALVFVNSDPNMMQMFIRFLRQELNVQGSDIRIHIITHATDTVEIAQIEQYWLRLLNLPQNSLKKTVIKQGSTTRYNILQHGVCSLRVYDTALTHHIFGAIQEYGGFEKPEWLF